MKTSRSSEMMLVLNAGSSSIRFALYPIRSRQRSWSGRIERIGLSGTCLQLTDPSGRTVPPRPIAGRSRHAATACLFDWLETQGLAAQVRAVGHRIVHGMSHTAPARITRALLARLRSLAVYDPSHEPRERELIEAVFHRFPGLPQVACFDTVFHRTLPRVARLLPIPRTYSAHGVERYGFHGLSYAYLREELRRLKVPAIRRGRLILAHLGNGASLAALKHGQSVDTTMGFTPAGGLVMSTRSGDLDPGVLSYLLRRERLSPAAFDHLVNQESGLLGISGISSDMRDLCLRAPTNPRAADAVDLFCYQAKKGIGAYAAALGGLDGLVFSGGIGENAPPIRARICQGLGFLGIRLDRARNLRNASIISRAGSAVTVRVIPTDEECMIARSTVLLLGLGRSKKPSGRRRSTRPSRAPVPGNA